MRLLFHNGELIFRRERLWSEPRFQTMADVAIAGGLAIGATSLGLSASGALTPNSPNLASSSRQISDAQAQLLPYQRQLEALAATGGSGTFSLPLNQNQQNQLNRLNERISNTTDPKQLANLQAKLQEFNQKYGQNQTVDFKGMGQADIQKTIADKMAQVGLQLSQKYDPQFIDEALKEQELANPEGVSARKQEYDLIQKQINDNPDQPVADLLNKQVSERVNAGKGLDEIDQSVLNNAVQQATSSRGGNNAPADFSAPLTTGSAGNARQLVGIQQGMSWLSSGATPEDVSYRREQQNLANLSSFENNQTPESQFRQLSGAQNGATPMVTGNALPTTQGNPVETASGAAGTTFGQLSNQVNPWLAGISTAINAGNTIANGIYSQQR